MVSLPQELERRISRFSTDYENNPNVSEAQEEAAHKALMRDFADWEASAQHDKHMALAAFGGSYYGDTESQVDKHLGKKTMTAPQYAIEVKDLKAMHKAITDRLPYQIETKTVPSPGAALGTPPVLRPELTQLLPYEPTDVFQLFPRQPAPRSAKHQRGCHHTQRHPPARRN